MSWNHGYVASIAVHAAVVGLAIFLARMAPPAREIEAQDPLLLEVWTSDGSTRDPGIPGRERGVADGVRTGNKAKVGPGGMPRLNFNANKLLEEMKRNDAKAAALAAAEAKAAREAKTRPDRDDNKPSDNTGKTSSKVSISDWRKSHPTSSKTASGATSPGGKTGATHGKTGTSVTGVRVGTGKGSGEDGFGNPGGKGQHGGDGGSGEALRLFSGDVRGKLEETYKPMFREQGGEISEDDECVVVVIVSPSGLARFGGWVKRPADSLMERIVIAAIGKMRLTLPPPDGKESTLHIPITGKITG